MLRSDSRSATRRWERHAVCWLQTWRNWTPADNRKYKSVVISFLTKRRRLWSIYRPKYADVSLICWPSVLSISKQIYVTHAKHTWSSFICIDMYIIWYHPGRSNCSYAHVFVALKITTTNSVCSFWYYDAVYSSHNTEAFDSFAEQFDRYREMPCCG